MSEEPTSSAAMISMIEESSASSVPEEKRNLIKNFKICNASDYQIVARSVLPKPLYEYLASGTDDEQTLSENESAFKNWYLRPRVMRPIGSISTATMLFGQKLSLPVFISPAGVHALCDEVHGECASARAAQKSCTLFGLSQHSTRSIEQVSSACAACQGDANLWFQCYILKDRDMTLRLVRRAVNAGYKGLFLTVDSVRFGYREADARNGWSALPAPHRLVNYDEEMIKQQHAGLDKNSIYSGDEDAWDQNTEKLFEQSPTWDDVRWLKEACNDLPLIIKGILTAEDAIEAVNAGADGVMVSNHGGRALDGALAAIDALPEVVKAIANRVPVLMDSGVRRGSDVVKALALGACAVGIGKPVFFALATGGEDAVVHLLQMLQKEVEAAMAICGIETVADIKPSMVSRHPYGSVTRYTRSML